VKSENEKFKHLPKESVDVLLATTVGYGMQKGLVHNAE